MSYVDEIQRLFSKPVTQAALILTLLVAVGVFAYWPGLNGSFQLDDFQNLAGLGNLPDSPTLQRAMNFVFTGTSGPAGRPVSLVTFLINDYAWPSDAWSFKYTNLMIHLLNGVLIFYLTLCLLPLLPVKLAQQRDKHLIAAGLGALIWTWHPLQVSTVLYIVQRMTELSTLFMLLGLIGYLHFRKQIDENPLPAFLKLSVAVGGSSILAVFAKENGILLFLYIFVLETIILANTHPVKHKYWRHWQAIFVIFPLVMMVAYVSFHIGQYEKIYQVREFNLWERLVSETRILFEYLYNIFLPKAGGNGLYHDDYVISRGLFEPVSSFFAFVGILGSLFLSVKFRRKQPVLTFAILWFFASHVLESTVIPLELYFEHRNYLAFYGFIVALLVYAYNLPKNIKPWSYVSLVLVTLMLAGFTRADANFWGNSKVAPFIWANEHPHSIRATQDASKAALKYNDMKLARKLIGQSLHYHPNDSGLMMQNFLLSCLDGVYEEESYNKLIDKIRKANYSSASVLLIEYLTASAPIKECSELDSKKVGRLIEAAIENPKFSSPNILHLLYFWRGQIAVNNRDLNSAMDSFDKASLYLKRAQVPLDQSKLLMTAGLYTDASRYLKLASEMDQQEKNVFLRNWHKKEIEALDKEIQSKINNKQASN